ncbi:hypothetical protein [Thermomonas sp.]|uniref:hypothetical protein n=1 Tax=Thermomonas sp. TaxID=1971895 RepID=UPI00261058EF|nr:hypothetical protein [Thermomonas sp.]
MKDLQLAMKNYTSPRLRVYGSVQALTAGGTGTTNETGMVSVPGMPGTPGNCYNGMTPGGNTSRKHCV